jgi:uncharacterized protein (TIGR02270 family)
LKSDTNDASATVVLGSPITDMLSRHAEDAAFYWSRYIEGTLSSLHDLRSLGRFDFLLAGNLEGLRVAQLEGGKPDADGQARKYGSAGWDAAFKRLSRWKTADEAFVCGVLALQDACARKNKKPPFSKYLGQLQDLACDQFDDSDDAGDLDIARGLSSAAAWLPWESVQAVVFDWARSSEPVLRRCAISACALQRLPAGDALAHWVTDKHGLVRARALRAVGELGRADLAGALIAEVNVEQGASGRDLWNCRYWAAWSLCMLGRSEGIATLGTGAAEHPPVQRTFGALAALSQVMEPRQLNASINAAFKKPQHLRNALTAIRFSGDIRWVGTLLQIMNDYTQPAQIEAFFAEPQLNLARLAADVMAHLTGLQIGEQLWMQAPEEADDLEQDHVDHDGVEAPDVASNPLVPAARKQDPDDGLLWPDVAAVSQWWSANKDRFQPGSGHAGRYVAGLPLTAASAKQILASPLATQLQRHHAALHLRCTSHTPDLFDVRASLPRQRAAGAALHIAIAR